MVRSRRSKRCSTTMREAAADRGRAERGRRGDNPNKSSLFNGFEMTEQEKADMHRLPQRADRRGLADQPGVQRPFRGIAQPSKARLSLELDAEAIANACADLVGERQQLRASCRRRGARAQARGGSRLRSDRVGALCDAGFLDEPARRELHLADLRWVARNVVRRGDELRRGPPVRRPARLRLRVRSD